MAEQRRRSLAICCLLPDTRVPSRSMPRYQGESARPPKQGFQVRPDLHAAAPAWAQGSAPSRGKRGRGRGGPSELGGAGCAGGGEAVGHGSESAVEVGHVPVACRARDMCGHVSCSRGGGGGAGEGREGLRRSRGARVCLCVCMCVCVCVCVCV